MTDEPTGPSDDAWFIDEHTEQRFGSGAAVQDDMFALTARLEGPEQDEFGNENRVYRSKGGRWHMSVLGDNFVSALRYPEPGLPPETIALLSAEGNVYVVTGGPQTRQERLVGAGMSSADSIGIGFMDRLRRHGDQLWACGMGGLLYRRAVAAGAPWKECGQTSRRLHRPPASIDQCRAGSISRMSRWPSTGLWWRAAAGATRPLRRSVRWLSLRAG